MGTPCYHVEVTEGDAARGIDTESHARETHEKNASGNGASDCPGGRGDRP